MRVSNEADLSDVLAAFHWVGSNIGKEFDDKTARQQPEFRRDRIVALHFLNNLHLEWLFAAAREYYAEKGQLPPDHVFDPLYSFFVSAHRIFAHLPSSAKSEFASKLRGFITGSVRINSGKEEEDVELGNLSSRSSGFDSHPVEASQPAGSESCMWRWQHRS